MAEAATSEARLDPDGPAAPPRENGELVFAEPWESRVFGLAIALCDQGVIEWQAFREQLIAEIGAFDPGRPRDQPFRYYRHWQRALEVVLDRNGLCGTSVLEGRARELAERPHDHDH